MPSVNRLRTVCVVLLGLLAGVLVLGSCDRAQSADDLPAKERLHVYILAGQSNMSGRARLEPDDRIAHERILMLDRRGRWVPAIEPLHRDDPPRAYAGLGRSFAQVMADADESITIGLVPCAWGSTALNRWERGGDLYEYLLERTRTAMQAGTLRGILWHQGETDAERKDAATTYAPRLARMIADLRTDLDQPDLPLVVGTLGDFTVANTRYPYARTVNSALRTIPSLAQHAACVDSQGLTDIGDRVHFDRASLQILGMRYADAMMRLHASTASVDEEHTMTPHQP